jgi:D-alanyl-lipoteichoic acid acyltransferase DltB (MBOAT superfamily)
VTESGKKKVILTVTVSLNVAILALLKYSNMFIGTYNYWSGGNVSLLKLAEPLAVSYYTLQLIAYVLDCYWGNEKAEKNPLKFLLYITYFPLMVSGPICRYSQIGKALFEEHRFDYDRVVAGMRRVLWGLAKKLIVADNLSTVVAYLYADPDTFTGIWILLTAMIFIVELYFDFSGCIDIVIGVSKCFGIILPENFRAPFFSKSIQEIWQRWHMTLGAWLRDYIMMPIQWSNPFKNMSRKLKKKWGKGAQKIPMYMAMFVVWTVIGIWHGSSWKYVVGCGWYYWLIITVSQILEPVFKKVKKALHISDSNILWKSFCVVRTFVLFAIGTMEFNASSLTGLFSMYAGMFHVSGSFMQSLIVIKMHLASVTWKERFVALVVLIAAQVVDDYMVNKGSTGQELVKKTNMAVRWIMYLALIFMILFYHVSTDVPFIYNQF